MSYKRLAKHESIELVSKFERELKEKEEIKLKLRERACLNRFVHWLYVNEWQIGRF